MKIKVKMLLNYMLNNNLSKIMLAQKIGISIKEIDKLLTGQIVDMETARFFIHYFGAIEAQKYIDWDAIGKENPFKETGGQNVKNNIT